MTSQNDRARTVLPMIGQRVRAINGSAIAGTIVSLGEDGKPRVRWDSGVEQGIAREKLTAASE